MMQKIMEMVSVHSGIPSALRLMCVNRKKKQKDDITIVFMCQLTHVWSCVESIYEAALKDNQVKVYILAVPIQWENGTVENDAYAFCKEKGYEVISAYDEKTKSFFDLQRLAPDYVFIPRPYDVHLPETYRSKEVSKYTKVCYVCYAYTAEDGYILKTCFNKWFTTNCYFIFAENASTYEYCVKNHPISSKLGVRKIKQMTYPRFDLLERWQGCEPKHWKLSRGQVRKRIIWAPRWTTDENLGGTSFFKYKDFFFQFAEEHPDVEVMIRPHPLAFDNFIKEGLMSEADVTEYKENCNRANNLQLDERREYLDSFASADILVADMSGVILDFLAMGKPIVFCSYGQELNSANEKLIEGFYVPHNVEELNEMLDALIYNQDSKQDLRDAVTKEVLGTCDGNGGYRILECIKNDASKSSDSL